MPKPGGAGSLRHRVYFERRGEGTDIYGNPASAWVPLNISRACSLLPTRGGEQVQAGRIAGVASWDCWVRSDAGTRSIQTGDRAVNERDATQTFNVAFIGDMDGGREWLLLQLVSGSNDG